MIARCRPLLGTFVEVTASFEAAAEAAYEAIARVHRLMSAHEPDSEVSRINRFGHRGAVQVHPWTAAVIGRALFWSEESRGAFDIVSAGADAIRSGRIPRHEDQPEPRASHWSAVEIDGTAVRLREAACLDLGGIAKGFAVDRALAAMRGAGAECGLVNAGGDIGGFGPQPWPVQVVRPDARRAIVNVAVQNGAIATSSIQPDGSAAHLPGISGGIVSATVSAPAAIDADALTKVVMAATPAAEHCLDVAEALAFVVGEDGGVRSLEPRRRAA